ncbi:MAG: TauD/TfdA family dioxygenase, partial [Myxococcales bacterium]|nr:TauD/TfdA family dioxygenase [Myxococcales bacterium]
SLGAEIDGLDVTNLDERQVAEVRAAFLEYHVLVFRDQKLTPDQQVAFAEHFGPLLIHPIFPHLEGYPPVIHIQNRGKKRTLTEVWHSDVTFEARPPLGTLLYALEVPDAGGDTLFANQHKAYERLSPGLKRMLDGLRAIHTGKLLGALSGEGERWKQHGQAHPVVRTHPETGRKALFVNRGFTVAFEDMTPEESAPLLRFLWEQATTPDVTCRHRWRPGDLVFWDNRSVMHYAIHDHDDAPRVLHRITVEGDTPV